MPHYISTGSQNNYYTLRVSYEDTVFVEGEARTIVRDMHVRNLSTDLQEARAKAKEQTGLALDTDIEVRPIGERRDNIDWSIFQAGKHVGKSIHEVYELDKGYLLWACENVGGSSRYAKTVELAKYLVENDLLERKQQHEQAVAQQKADNDSAVSLLMKKLDAGVEGGAKEFLARGSESTSQWLRGVCDSILEGNSVGLRCEQILMDIRAKEFGRRNSKAYRNAMQIMEAV